MIKVEIGEFDCRYESTPFGGFSFYVENEADLDAAIDELRRNYAGGVEQVFERTANGTCIIREDERCYKAFSCGGDCYQC